MNDACDHRETAYRSKPSDGVSRYQLHAWRSLDVIRAIGLGPGARIIEVGGGAFALVDDLLAGGWRDLTVLDLPELHSPSRSNAWAMPRLPSRGWRQTRARRRWAKRLSTSGMTERCSTSSRIRWIAPPTCARSCNACGVAGV